MKSATYIAVSFLTVGFALFWADSGAGFGDGYDFEYTKKTLHVKVHNFFDAVGNMGAQP